MAASPKSISSSGTGAATRSTSFAESTMTTNRSARRGDALLAGVGCTATLDDPARVVDLVGSVDRDVQMVEGCRHLRTARRGAPPRGPGRWVATDVATHRRSRPRAANAGSMNATVDPVPRPTRIPSSTMVAERSAAMRFSRSTSGPGAPTPRDATRPTRPDPCRATEPRRIRRSPIPPCGRTGPTPQGCSD